MKAIIVSSLLILLCAQNFAYAQDPHFEIFGFGLATDISSLKTRFPSSAQHAIDLSGSCIYHYQPPFMGADGKQHPEYVNGSYAQKSTNTYEIWFSNNDVHNSMGYLSFGITAGRVKRLRFVFEMPEKNIGQETRPSEKGLNLRNPSCTSILTNLAKIYGEPHKMYVHWEENLSCKSRHWFYHDEEMKLSCNQLDGKGQESAAELLIYTSK